VDIYKILLTTLYMYLSCFGGTLGSGILVAASCAFVPHTFPQLNFLLMNRILFKEIGKSELVYGHFY
jgi:hypothetical protein